jgi:hypothetical protein
MDESRVLGWREWVSLPAWGVTVLHAKLDTGARTCAVHVERIEELAGGRVRFELVYREEPRRRVRWVEAELVRRSSVKPSHGRAQDRPVVRTRMRLGPLDRVVEISLVSRTSMQCRMLVGRSALEGALVDPSRTHLVTPQSRKAAKQASS